MVDGDTEAEKTETATKGLSEHSIWLWTLVPIALVGLRILIVSRGNSDTLRALVQNLNVSAIFLATVLPFVSLVFVLLFVFILAGVSQNWFNREALARAGKPKEWLKNLLLGSVLVLPFSGVLCWYAMPMKYIVAAAIMAGAFIALAVLSLRFKRLVSLILGLAILALIVASVVILLSQVGVWLPRERLTIDGVTTGTVYVLSAEDQWTKYLDEEHEVVIVPSAAVSAREPIRDRRDWTSLTLSEFFAA